MSERGRYFDTYPYHCLRYLFGKLGAEFVTAGGEGNPDRVYRYEINRALREGVLELRDDPEQFQPNMTTHFNINKPPQPIRTFKLTFLGRLKFGLLEEQTEKEYAIAS